MPEQQKEELVLWQEPVEKVYAEEIPNTDGFYYQKEKKKSDLGLYVFIGFVLTAGFIQILNDRKDIKQRSEERKRNAAAGL